MKQIKNSALGVVLLASFALLAVVSALFVTDIITPSDKKTIDAMAAAARRASGGSATPERRSPTSDPSSNPSSSSSNVALARGRWSSTAGKASGRNRSIA